MLVTFYDRVLSRSLLTIISVEKRKDTFYYGKPCIYTTESRDEAAGLFK